MSPPTHGMAARWSVDDTWWRRTQDRSEHVTPCPCCATCVHACVSSQELGGNATLLFYQSEEGNEVRACVRKPTGLKLAAAWVSQGGGLGALEQGRGGSSAAVHRRICPGDPCRCLE